MLLKHQGNIQTRKMFQNSSVDYSSYPLILCIELQCGVSQQERLAQLLIEIFGDKLYLDQVIGDANLASNEYRPLLSPNDLRGKVIIKVNEISSKGNENFL